MRYIAPYLGIWTALLVISSAGQLAWASEDTATQILRDRCGSCHGKVNPQSGVNVFNVEELKANGYVVDGNLDESGLWERIGTEDTILVMPPSGPLPEEEISLVRQWILSGAPIEELATQARPMMPIAELVGIVAEDLRSIPREDRSRIRYLSLLSVYNNQALSEADLRLYRAAVSKLINSLSWRADILIPEIVGEAGVLLRIDLAKLDWHAPGDDRWGAICREYPYGLAFDQSANSSTRDDAFFIYEATGTRTPVIRADWFVATASRPPLYHQLLELPTTEAELEEMLQVDVEADFRANLVARAGFSKSNVSQFNRVVDRHTSMFGAYWKSYDFGSAAGRRAIFSRPLGPQFAGNQFTRHAFDQDGGEMVFHLPNGLQGYFIVDSEGNRIDEAPIQIVADSKSPLGNEQVINGISCMVCHREGMQVFVDEIRDSHGLTGEAAQKVRRLYLEQDEMRKFVDRDRDRFLLALEQAIGSFARGEEDADFPITKYREPVGAIAGHYSRDLTIEDIMAELGIDERGVIEAFYRSRDGRQLGLGGLAEGGVVDRTTWATAEPYSAYQEMAEELGIGIPERTFD